jgi:hypothetical protein
MRMVSDGDEKIKTYRTVETLLSSAAIVRIPCGVCPVIKIVLFFFITSIKQTILSGH